jgi:iron(III) transport system ATP-binding protein
VLLDGQEVAGPEHFVPPEKRGVGLMFQDLALFPHLSILQNVAFGLRSLTRSEANAEALTALSRVGFAHYAHSTRTPSPEASSSAWPLPGQSRHGRTCSS